MRRPSVWHATGWADHTLGTIKDGMFRPLTKLGARASATLANDMRACNDAVIRGSAAEEFKVLVVRLVRRRRFLN